MEIQSHSLRFYFLTLFTGILFFILFLRLISLQIYQGKDLKKFSDNNRFKKQLLIAPRGLILDRYNEILVGNKKTVQALIYLNQTKSLNESLQKISKIIQIPIKNLYKKIEKEKKRQGPFHPIVLKENLSLIEIHKLNQLHWDYPEIQVREFDKRVYPLKENGSQFLGFIGSISKKDIQNFKKKNRLFHLGDWVGKSGLEKVYDKDLKGQNGFSMIEVDAQNRISASSSSQFFDALKIDPKKGKDLVLTIDKELQIFVSKAMKRKDSIGLRTGAIVVMKSNGEILSLLSTPSFDPNTLTSNIHTSLWNKWSIKGSKIFLNKAIQEHYSPGSTFKPFIALAALEEGIITKDTLLDSPGTFKLGRKIYYDHNPLGHGSINVITALEKSANTFFYQIADQLGIDKIHHYAQLFGFGQKSQIGLFGENPGLLPNPLWKKKNKINNRKWHRGDTINVSIGQGDLLVTLLQLTIAYNAIATQGLILKPFLIKQKANGKLVKPTILESLTDRIQRNHFLTVKEGLKKVVEGAQGTARYYKISSTSFSGKTGTSQVIALNNKKLLYRSCKKLAKQHRHHGWFLSFAPSDQPEIVVAVFTEHSCSGSSGSAPIARDIIRFYEKTRGFQTVQ